MATETTHTRAQLQDDINRIRDRTCVPAGYQASAVAVLDAAQRYCDTLPKVHHVRKWGVIDRKGVLRLLVDDRGRAEAFASSSNFVVCELTGSCEL